MKKKRLPLSFQNDLNGYLLYAYPYCILNAHRAGKLWAMDHYFQTCAYINESNDINLEILDAVSYGKFYTPHEILRARFYQDADDIVNHVKNSIDNDEYVVVFIDESQRGLTNSHLLHEILIYGYEGEQFSYVAFDRNMLFADMRIFADDLARAFELGREIPTTLAADWASYRRVINYTFLDIPYAPNQVDVQFCFRRYWEGGMREMVATDNKRASYTMYQGIDNTRLFLKIIEQYGEDYQNHIPYAGFHLLYETKQLLYKRIDAYHLMPNVQAYADVVACFNNARMHALKMEISHSTNASKLYDVLHEGYQIECRLLR